MTARRGPVVVCDVPPTREPDVDEEDARTSRADARDQARDRFPRRPDDGPRR
ncbi:MAG: hypothetical protein AB7I45_08855 [Planctomycetota bacterium]